MRVRTKLILVALAATAILAAVVSAATAGRLSVNERNFELIWNEAFGAPKTKVEFIARANNVNVQCKLTLLGRFNETTIKKETSTNQGTINHGDLDECQDGTATVRTETMPWGVRYRSFSGTLPTIRSLSFGLIGARFQIREAGGVVCEAGSEVNHPGVFIIGNSSEAPETGFETTGMPENVTADRVARIPLRGEFLCAFIGEGEFGGIGLVRNLPRTAKIRITLI